MYHEEKSNSSDLSEYLEVEKTRKYNKKLLLGSSTQYIPALRARDTRCYL